MQSKSINKEHPKISVVMSCYNREQYLNASIESILNQTYDDFEFIIFDDCSTDNSAKIIESYAKNDDRIIFIKNKKNEDCNYCFRKGLNIAKGEYIARMDDDDISMPTRFEKQIKFLDNNKDIIVLGTFIGILDEKPLLSWVTETDPDIIEILMHFYNPICHSSVMIRKSFLRFHNLNYLAEDVYAEDYGLWKNIILRGGKIANLSEILLKYRIHDNRISSNKDSSKIQVKTARKIQYELLERFFSSNKKIEMFLKNIIAGPYSFEKNSPKTLFYCFEELRKNNRNFISNTAFDKIKEKYCGVPCTMNIFFAADDKFSQHLCVAMTSILVNSLPFENFNFYILDGGISNIHKKIISKIKKIKNCYIEYIKIDDSIVEKFNLSDFCPHVSKETFYRYLIPQLKPEIDKSFYFDCDIVAENSLNKFWHTNLKENYIAGIEELWVYAHNYYKSLGIEKSFNSGIMLINNIKWRKDNISIKLIENNLKLQNQNLLLFPDQDILNYTFNNAVLFVHPKYNLQQKAYFDGQHSLYTNEEIEEAKSQPIIIHYSGQLKPWNEECWHPKWKRYHKYLKLSPYKNKYYIYKCKKLLNKYIKSLTSQKSTKPIFSISSYIKYKLLSKITFGKMRKRYKEKYRSMKNKLKSIC